MIRKIQYVAFSEGLKYIGTKAFYYQQAIEKLELPASLEEIDTFAFYECEKVNTLTFGDDATHDSQLQILHSSFQISRKDFLLKYIRAMTLHIDLYYESLVD